MLINEHKKGVTYEYVHVHVHFLVDRPKMWGKNLPLYESLKC
jgi:hypothetical protein